MNVDYSSGVVKEIIQDANMFSQSRCEFKIPSYMNVLSNIKLANLGATRAGGGDCSYNRGAGAIGLISRIALMDGAELLSECREVGKQMTFRNHNNPNNVNNSIKTPHQRSAAGFDYSVGALAGGAGTDTTNVYNARNFDGFGFPVLAANSDTAVLVLSDLLPILNQVEMLDSKVFKNDLRVVIEWETDVRKMVTRNDVTLTILSPLLCYYSVEDDSLYNELKMGAGVVSWYEREIDTRPYASLVSQTQRFNGFDNKRVLRAVVVKESTTNATYDNGAQVLGKGKNGSFAFPNEGFNVVNNGVQIFPEDLTYNDIARQTINAFGPCSGFQGFNLRQGVTAANSMPNFSTLTPNNNILPGECGYNGFSLANEVVKNLQVKIDNPNRGTNVGGGVQDAHRVSVMGDVAKMMSVGADGSYTISYA